MLRERAFRATTWSAADLALRQGLQFAVTIVLARLLTPADFGIIAVLSLFTIIAATLVDGGFSTALVQRQSITRTDESTVFWINLTVGIVMAAMVVSASPWIADFFGNQLLQPLAMLLSATIVLNAAGAVPLALLTKSLQFRRIMGSGVLATLVAGVVAVVLAAHGFGVWALGAYLTVMSAFTTAMLWLLSGWRPQLVLSRGSAAKLFGFGGFVFAANIIDVVFARLYTLVAGRFFGLTEVGFYNRAEAAQQLPVTLIANAFSRVALPLLSSVAHQPDRLTRAIRTSVSALMFVSIPVMLGLAAVGDPFIRLVLGDQWEAAIPLFQVLCLAGTLWPLHIVNIQVLMATGRSRLFFQIEIVKKSVGVVLLLVGSLYGLLGIAWSQVAFGVFSFAVNSHYTKKYLGYGALSQSRDCLPILACALPAVGLAWVVSSLLREAPIVELGVAVSAATVIFFGLSHIMKLTALGNLMVGLREAREKARGG